MLYILIESLVLCWSLMFIDIGQIQLRFREVFYCHWIINNLIYLLVTNESFAGDFLA